MQLLLLTPENDHPRETALVRDCFAQGLQRLHLRKPMYTRADYKYYLRQIDRTYHNRIVLHGHFELLNDFDLGGIHFNTAMRHDAALVQEFSGYGKKSASFHAWQEIADDTGQYRYVFISPVFDSISKKGYEAAVDLGGAGALRKSFRTQNRQCPLLMGLGGVTAANITKLAGCGFDGAVALGSVWHADDPVAACAHIMNVVKGECRL